MRPLAEKLAYYGASFSPAVLARAGVDAATVRSLRDADPATVPDLVPPAMMTLGVSGTPDEVAERCRSLVAAGARHVSFGPPLGPDRLRSRPTPRRARRAPTAGRLIVQFGVVYRCERRGASRGAARNCAGLRWRGRGTQ